MKKFLIYSLLIVFVSTLTFTGCKESTSDEAVAYQTLTTYMKSNGKDLSDIMGNKDAGTFFVMAAPADGNLSSKWIMDIRSAADFAAGHIDGAHNVAFTNILTAAADADKPIVVVCYTGQTACYATSLLRMYGYSDAKALKWGMSGWNAQFDKWTPNCKDITSSSNWNTTANDAGSFSAPSLSSSATTGDAILKERVEAVVSAGFKNVTGADVLANPANYYINNYFSADHYNGFGHINGAVRILPLGIDNLNNLDPGNKVVTYCYTGQTSAIITAFLNVVGFEAYSLLFGINGMSKSNSYWTTGNVTNHWGHDSNPKSLPTVN